MSSRSGIAPAVLVAVFSLVIALSTPSGAAAWPAQAGPDTSTGAIVYTQAPNPNGGLYQSSHNGTDYDRWVWDDFTIPMGRTVTITEVQWRGGYDPAKMGSGGPVLDFRVAIYPSITGGSQPDVIHGPVVDYLAGGVAGETPAGTFGGVTMYDYGFTLPASFTVSGPAKYWVHIEALQGGLPDWGMSAATGGNGTHFLGMPVAGDVAYFIVSGDAAFTLLGTVTPSSKAYLPVLLRR